jgi:hypothetical protein
MFKKTVFLEIKKLIHYLWSFVEPKHTPLPPSPHPSPTQNTTVRITHSQSSDGSAKGLSYTVTHTWDLSTQQVHTIERT